VLSGVTYLQIVRSQIGWWGIARPPPGRIKGFLGLSWWFLLWNLVMHAMKGGDVIVLGAVAGTALVTTYTLTSYVPQAVSDVVFMVISATMPGLGGLVGAGDLQRAARVRGETMVLSWLVAVSAGAAVIVWLPPFLDMWVGAQYYAGTTATVLICVAVLQLALIRVDSNVIDVTLHVRAKVLLGLLSVCLAAALGVLLVGPAGLGISGLVVALIVARVPISLAYPVLVGRLLGLSHALRLSAVWRPACTSVVVFGFATWIGGFNPAANWLSLVVLGPLTAGLALAVAYVAGLSRGQRCRVRTRVVRVVHLS
jgi:O-antigen/teichoic acid export membrane protein